MDLLRLERILERNAKKCTYEIEEHGNNEFTVILTVDESFSVKHWNRIMGVLQLYFDIIDNSVIFENRFGYLRYLKFKVTPVYWPED